ncbi:MAG: hypothetical protein ACI31I_03000 [Bacilli bacterium]
MFDNQIKLYGKHSEILKKYSREKGSQTDVIFRINNNDNEPKDIYLFENYLSCYMCAAMLGIVYDRKADMDNNRALYATIFYEKIRANKHLLDRIYQHMVLTKCSDESIDGAIKKAFSPVVDTNEKTYEELFDSYVRGGLELLDEKFGNSESYEDIANNIYSLKEMFENDEF